jgi:DNA-binding MarR family transcriptional regulator
LISRLTAEKMDVTAQAASKSTGELERMGYVTRTPGRSTTWRRGDCA